MKKSTSVTVGLVLAAGISFACASGEDDQEFMDVNADHQQVCVKVEDEDNFIRADDDKCPDENEHHAHFYPGYYYWYYMGSAHGSPPPVGSKVSTTSGSFTRPTSGTIARPPASGGFGVFRVPVGS